MKTSPLEIFARTQEIFNDHWKNNEGAVIWLKAPRLALRRDRTKFSMLFSILIFVLCLEIRLVWKQGNILMRFDVTFFHKNVSKICQIEKRISGKLIYFWWSNFVPVRCQCHRGRKLTDELVNVWSKQIDRKRKKTLEILFSLFFLSDKIASCLFFFFSVERNVSSSGRSNRRHWEKDQELTGHKTGCYAHSDEICFLSLSEKRGQTRSHRWESIK